MLGIWQGGGVLINWSMPLIERDFISIFYMNCLGNVYNLRMKYFIIKQCRL